MGGFVRYDTSNQGHLTKSQLLCLLMDLRLLGNAHTCDVMEAMFTEADESFQGRVTQELFEACSHRFISMQLHTRLRRHTSLSDSHDGACARARVCLCVSFIDCDVRFEAPDVVVTAQRLTCLNDLGVLSKALDFGPDL